PLARKTRSVTQKPLRISSPLSCRKEKSTSHHPRRRSVTMSLAGVERRRIACLAAALAQGRVERGLPRAVLERLGQRLVDELAQLRVVRAVADPVALLGEGLADDLELVGVLGGVAEQDRRIGRHG